MDRSSNNDIQRNSAYNSWTNSCISRVVRTLSYSAIVRIHYQGILSQIASDSVDYSLQCDILNFVPVGDNWNFSLTHSRKTM